MAMSFPSLAGNPVFAVCSKIIQIVVLDTVRPAAYSVVVWDKVQIACQC
jgi:hypothetical protein